MLRFTTEDGTVLGTVRLESGRLLGSSPDLQKIADITSASWMGDAATAYRWLARGNGYLQAQEVP